jgi:hypothetical protein
MDICRSLAALLWLWLSSCVSEQQVVQATMVRDRQHGPVIELNRIQVKRSRSKGGLAGPDGMKSVFGQMVSKMSLLTQEALFLPHRVWKVKFVGKKCVGYLVVFCKMNSVLCRNYVGSLQNFYRLIISLLLKFEVLAALLVKI